MRKSSRYRGNSQVPFNAGRRRFLAGVAGAAGAIALPGCGTDAGSGAADVEARAAKLPTPEDCGIDHIVQVMMENRSYDHMLGWVPKSDGIQSGLAFRNIEGTAVPTFHLAADRSTATRAAAGPIRRTATTTAACTSTAARWTAGC